MRGDLYCSKCLDKCEVGHYDAGPGYFHRHVEVECSSCCGEELWPWAYWVQYRWDRRQWERKGVHHGFLGMVG